MKNYVDFAAEDFAADDDFIKWVRHPHPGSSRDIFWKSWIRANPAKAEEIEEARMMILAVVEEPQHIPDATKQQEVWQKIKTTLELPNQQPVPLRPWQQWYSKAAILVILFGGVWLLWRAPFDGDPGTVAVQIPAGLERRSNDSNQARTIVLEDGSSVVLQPHSVLQYPAHFTPQMRDVYLTGEAFFEVKKDPHRPFLVHAQDLVTRVLGTSFRVRSFAREARTTVQVKTGRVSVSKVTEAPAGQEAVVLTPNQQVVYERAGKKLTKSLVEKPEVLQPFAGYSFEFNDVPVSEVFETLEKAYGIQIVYDEESLARCLLHATLTEVPLDEQLKLICKGIQGTYEVIDSHIVITSRGCTP
ncbi:FecR family protein [Dawidia soli]|uniref:FecR domain-containing protein n=1 Tax=Dawidia soli TaxID=2782352 RepID=A0AAP2DCE4_9BACT|nr:FecR family protein [Dawidia soli]MBT1689184.1 FecR domain-containing protein [Dawidia soli]